MSEINVVPYIDVTLVLLIIFMITTPMLQTGVDVNLPQTESAMVDQKDDPPIVISIDKQVQYYINVDGQTDEPVMPEDIYGRVTAALTNKPGRQVLINADEVVGYGIVVKAMASLKNAGVPSVGLMTKSSEQ
ncbi:MAG: protein TolR [Methylobacter sp.]|jgi:biopolymer transport protein TolR